jgi:hypothetical protein
LDEYNRPLYGDVFGVLPKISDTNVRVVLSGKLSLTPFVQVGEPVDKNLWGELEPEEGKFICVIPIVAISDGTSRRGVRGGRRIGRRGGRRYRGSSSRWSSDAFWLGNAVWHGQRRFHRRWGT